MNNQSFHKEIIAISHFSMEKESGISSVMVPMVYCLDYFQDRFLKSQIFLRALLTTGTQVSRQSASHLDENLLPDRACVRSSLEEQRSVQFHQNSFLSPLIV